MMTVSTGSIPKEDERFFWKRFVPSSEQRSRDLVPLILLHDSLGSVDQWRDFPQRLADACRRVVVAYDRMGHGRSPSALPAKTLSFIEHEADFLLTQVLPAVDTAKFLVFGHSVGGAIAAVAAAKAGERCLALITEGAQAFVEERTIAGIKAVQESAEGTRLIERLQRYHADKSQAVFDSWTQSWLSSDAAAWTLKPWLAAVVAPTLVFHGDQDEFGGARHPEMIASSVAGRARKLMLEGIGHVPHRECADLVLDAVARFLEEHAD